MRSAKKEHTNFTRNPASGNTTMCELLITEREQQIENNKNDTFGIEFTFSFFADFLFWIL